MANEVAQGAPKQQNKGACPDSYVDPEGYLRWFNWIQDGPMWTDPTKPVKEKREMVQLYHESRKEEDGTPQKLYRKNDQGREVPLMQLRVTPPGEPMDRDAALLTQRRREMLVARAARGA